MPTQAFKGNNTSGKCDWPTLVEMEVTVRWQTHHSIAVSDTISINQ